MLASANQQEIEYERIAGLEVQVPANLAGFFCESGYLPTTAAEARGNARLRVRSIGDVLLAYTPAGLRGSLAGRNKRTGKVLIKDLSRSGIGILYHVQIFPEEHLQIRFQGRLINAVVVRCRRLGEKCYEVGGRITSIEAIGE